MLELLLIIGILYLFAIRCRSGHPGLKELQGWNYAHRGLHGNGIPENSMAAFRAAAVLQQPGMSLGVIQKSSYGIEMSLPALHDITQPEHKMPVPWQLGWSHHPEDA